MSKEYRTVYTVDGKGYSPTEPWIDDVVKGGTDEQNLAHAIDLLNTLYDFNESMRKPHEEWIEVRDVTDWTRTKHMPRA